MKFKYSLNQRVFFQFFFLVLGFAHFSSMAQISGGEIKPDKEKGEKGVKSPRIKQPFMMDSIPATYIYVEALGQYAFRSFEDLSVYSIYKQEVDEKPIYTTGYSLGLVMPLGKGFAIDAGLTFFGNGESYAFAATDSDSTFNYKKVYQQGGIPFKLRYTVGNRFQFYGYAGLTPLNILAIRYTSAYSTADGSSVDLGLVIKKDEFTTFNLMASGGIGLNYLFNSWGIHLSAEYRKHLMNTYSESTFKRNHFMYGIGVNLGVQMKF
jgi:hypothetical protein